MNQEKFVEDALVLAEKSLLTQEKAVLELNIIGSQLTRLADLLEKEMSVEADDEEPVTRPVTAAAAATPDAALPDPNAAAPVAEKVHDVPAPGQVF